MGRRCPGELCLIIGIFHLEREMVMRHGLRMGYFSLFLASMIAGGIFVSHVNMPTPETRKKVEYLVATRNISVGELISRPEDCFKLVSCYEGNEPTDAIVSFDELAGII